MFIVDGYAVDECGQYHKLKPGQHVYHLDKDNNYHQAVVQPQYKRSENVGFLCNISYLHSNKKIMVDPSELTIDLSDLEDHDTFSNDEMYFQIWTTGERAEQVLISAGSRVYVIKPDLCYTASALVVGRIKDSDKLRLDFGNNNYRQVSSNHICKHNKRGKCFTTCICGVLKRVFGVCDVLWQCSESNKK